VVAVLRRDRARRRCPLSAADRPPLVVMATRSRRQSSPELARGRKAPVLAGVHTGTPSTIESTERVGITRFKRKPALQ
jgi:hypothetical protein